MQEKTPGTLKTYHDHTHATVTVEITLKNLGEVENPTEPSQPQSKDTTMQSNKSPEETTQATKPIPQSWAEFAKLFAEQRQRDNTNDPRTTAGHTPAIFMDTPKMPSHQEILQKIAQFKALIEKQGQST